MFVILVLLEKDVGKLDITIMLVMHKQNIKLLKMTVNFTQKLIVYFFVYFETLSFGYVLSKYNKKRKIF